MEKTNKKLIYEALLIHNAFNNELSNMTNDTGYLQYHQNKADWCSNFQERLNQILKFNGEFADDFVSHVSKIELTAEQKRAVANLRREPMFKKLMGESAEKQKGDLENLFGERITSEGMTFADEEGARVATKSEQQLDQEFESYSDKLFQLLSNRSLTEEQYEKYDQMLDYLYAYYISQSKGEQIPFRKISDAQYGKFQELADENGISLSEQIYKATKDLTDIHNELQGLQSQSIKR